MPSIKESSIRDLKQRISIQDVVAPVVSLKKAGSQFRGLSPFNAEKTPSFFISPDKGLFKCFSSGKSGDQISFVMETERLTFTEAVETLARRFNVTLEYEAGGQPREDRSLRQELFELHEAAADHFARLFWEDTPEAREIRDYWLRQRRFPEETARDYRIGLAPSDGGGLFQRLQGSFSPQALRESGLFFFRTAGPPRARFRGRLMIPIRDFQGRTIAFTARQMPFTPADDPAHEAKYVNSPETPLFTKGHVLFNLDRARLKAGPEAPFLMVEGQLDAIRCHQVGLETAIAPQGTGVTPDQIRLIARYAAPLHLLLDGDRAGREAALRVLPLALAQNVHLRFLTLPQGSDPDLFLLEGGPAAYQELVDRAEEPAGFACRSLVPDPDSATPEEKREACRRLFEWIAAADSASVREDYLQQIADSLRLPRPALSADFTRFLGQRRRRRPPPQAETQTATAPFSTAEEDLLSLCLHHPHLAPPLAAVLDHDWLPETSPAARLLNRLLAEVEHGEAESFEPDHLAETDEERSLLASLRFSPPDHDDPARVANMALQRLVRRYTEKKISEIDVEIARKARSLPADLNRLLEASTKLRHLKLNPPSLPVPEVL
ncbi:MAG: DNA primase [Puniceicoccaceae bacterium]|nr:MAG: DNA primase [Puniceicoccaceae bacterium]